MCRNSGRSSDDNIRMSTDDEPVVIPDEEEEEDDDDEDEDEEPEEDEYVVEAIRAWRYHCLNKRKEFLIKWQGWPESTNTWEPEDNLKCDELMEEFINKLGPKQLRFFRCERPDKLTGFRRNAEYVGCLGTDGPHSSDDEETGTKSKKVKAYVLLKFADSGDVAEEVSLEEFFQHQPEEALKFCEERILCRKDSASSSSQTDGDQHTSASTSRDRSHD